LTQSIKQRVVGALVLLAIALIFLPVIFDGQGSYQQNLQSRIPEPPPIPDVPDTTPTRPTIVADTDAIKIPPTNVAGADTSVSAANDKLDAVDTPTVDTETTPSESPSLDAEGLPRGWSVRLASFSSVENASRLVSRLQDDGYKAYSREIQSSQGALTAVFVGPGVRQERIQQLRLQLQDVYELAGIVVPFELEEL